MAILAALWPLRQSSDADARLQDDARRYRLRLRKRRRINQKTKVAHVKVVDGARRATVLRPLPNRFLGTPASYFSLWPLAWNFLPSAFSAPPPAGFAWHEPQPSLVCWA
jgi:hypothetical protein